jgi:microcystin-dependent protein
MAPTSRLGLTNPVGTDLISAGDNAIAQIVGVLDRSALWLVPGTFAARPAASGNDGRFYLASDVGIIYVSDGTNWIEVSRGGGSVPIGALLDYAGSGDPADSRYLLADGRAISRTTYAAAYAIMGTTYGTGDGSTTFNIPDYRGRHSVGPDNMGTGMSAAGRMASNNTRGASGGAETKTIGTANLPAHTHDQGTLATASGGAHTHAVGTLATSTTGAHTHTVGTLATVSTGAHTHGGATGVQSADHAHDMSHDHPLGMYADLPGFGGSRPAGSSGGASYDVGGGGASNPVKMFNGNTGGMNTSHNHSISSDGAHTHSLSGATASNGDHSHTLSGLTASDGAHTHTISGVTGSVGSGTALNFMTPYVVVNKIVRVS